MAPIRLPTHATVVNATNGHVRDTWLWTSSVA
jgi:hypothetical protein